MSKTKEKYVARTNNFIPEESRLNELEIYRHGALIGYGELKGNNLEEQTREFQSFLKDESFDDHFSYFDPIPKGEFQIQFKSELETIKSPTRRAEAKTPASKLKEDDFSELQAPNPKSENRSSAARSQSTKDNGLVHIDDLGKAVNNNRPKAEKPQTEEDSVFNEILLGDFYKGNPSVLGMGANIGIGLIPVVGQIADARDTLAALKGVYDEPTSWGSWGNLGLASIGWIPAIGDAVKGAKKLGKVGEKVLERSTKKFSHELSHKAAKETKEIVENSLKKLELTPARLKDEVTNTERARKTAVVKQVTTEVQKVAKESLRINIYATPSNFRRRLTKILMNEQDHPLKNLINRETRKLHPSTQKGMNEFYWFEHPEAIQIGHVESKLKNVPDKVVIMTAFENQMLKSTIEGKGAGASIKGGFDILIIDGIPISVTSAEHLVRFKKLDVEVFANAMWKSRVNIDDL